MNDQDPCISGICPEAKRSNSACRTTVPSFSEAKCLLLQYINRFVVLKTVTRLTRRREMILILHIVRIMLVILYGRTAPKSAGFTKPLSISPDYVK
jgi:hypothetical protein